MPCAAASANTGWVGRQPGEGDDEIDGPIRRHTGGVFRPEPDVDAEDGEDLGALVDRSGCSRRTGIDDGDDGPALPQRIGRGEAADPQACDEHPQTRPVGVAVGEARARLITVVDRISEVLQLAHVEPTTHSA
jgi:hypothetical protein